MASPPPPVVSKVETRRPRSSQQVLMEWNEEEGSGSRHTTSRLNLQMSQCVETKTVTTTTTLKRSYPPLLVREPRPLSQLDTKEYPLATRPTPPELKKFTFDFHDDEMAFSQDLSFDHRELQQLNHASDFNVKTEAEPEVDSGPNTPLHDTPSPAYLTRQERVSSRPRNRPSAYGSLGRSGLRANRPPLSNSIRERFHRPPLDHNRRAASAGYLATPDTTEVIGGESGRRRRSLIPNPMEQIDSAQESQTNSLYNAASPDDSDAHTAFSGSVATPPVTDADLEPLQDADESQQHSIRAHHRPRPTVDTVAAQDASLPSPGLSPTLQAAQLQGTQQDEDVEEDDDEIAYSQQITRRPGRNRWLGESQSTIDGNDGSLLTLDDEDQDLVRYRQGQRGAFERAQNSLLDARSMVETFDSMPNEMKTMLMYQLLRRCPRKTLHMVADVVNPALKCDFLKELPIELSLHVLSYLDHRDLCRAAQVSSLWRTVIDGNETGWKALFDRDGFVLTGRELEKAIEQGWGWQDPVGVYGAELDLSLQSRMTGTEMELLRSAKPAPTQKLRSSKRKRGIPSSAAQSERSKRRASIQEGSLEDKPSSSHQHQVDGQFGYQKVEGPIAAATAANLAVSDPGLGLPSLRRMHLYKSLYRRHYMIRQNWMNKEVQPGHVAFAAHPRHVITCLQFDDDKIITGSDDTLIHVYDTNTGKRRQKLEGHEGGVWALQYVGNTLVSGSTDRSVRVWDIEKGLCTQVFYGHTSTVRCLQILMPTDTGEVRNGKAVMMPPKPLIITGSRDSQLRVWRLPDSGSRRYIMTGPPANDAECPYFIRILAGHTHSVRAISAHGDTLVSGSYDSTVRVWKISTGEQLHVLMGHSQKVYSVVYDHQRNRCISGSMDSVVRIWDLKTGSCLHSLEGHTLLVGLLDLRDDRLVSAAADSTLRIWDPENGRCRNILQAHTAAITCFQHDATKVISGSEKTVKMWDIQTGDCVEDLLTDLSGVWQVKFDNRRCVAAVQREGLTYIEILDYGAVRDGKAPEELGKRILLNAPEDQALIEEEA